MPGGNFSVHVRFDRHGRPISVEAGEGERLNDGRGHPVVAIRSGLTEARALEIKGVLAAAIDRNRDARPVVIAEPRRRAAPTPVFLKVDSEPSSAPELAQHPLAAQS